MLNLVLPIQNLVWQRLTLSILLDFVLPILNSVFFRLGNRLRVHNLSLSIFRFPVLNFVLPILVLVLPRLRHTLPVQNWLYFI